MEFLSQDQLAKLMFNKGLEVTSYNFDIFYDIKKIVDYSSNADNYRDEHKSIITNKPVRKTFKWFIRETGSYLVDIEDTDWIKAVEKNFESTLGIYEITITANCDYIYKESFAKVEKIG